MVRNLVVLTLLVGVTCAVYFPATRFEFIAFDDDGYVYENEHVRDELSAETLKWAFTSSDMSNWHPLTWLSHALDCHWYGTDQPGWHHLTNLLLHSVNTLLICLLLWRMTGDFWPAAFVAALFALHPLHVESVAWVSERKDVLSTLFWLLSIGAYVEYVLHRRWSWYVASFLLLALGLLAKPMLVTAPFLLLLLDYWPLARYGLGPGPSRESKKRQRSGSAESPPSGPLSHLPWRARTIQLVAEKIPMIAIVIASSIVTYIVQKAGGAVTSAPWDQRLATVLTAYVRYICKTFWPDNLSPLYPIHPNMWQAWQLLACAVVLLAISGVVWWLRANRYLVVGWLWFLGLLVPVVGFVPIGDHSMADRYMYLAMTGLTIMVAWGAADVCRHAPSLRWLIGLLSLAAIGLCVWRTPLQLAKWKDSITLFTHAIAVTDRNYAMHNNLGAVLAGRGRQSEALQHYRSCLDIRGDFGRAHNNLAVLLREEGQVDQALYHFQEALRVGHQTPQVYNNLGIVLQGKHQLGQAVRCFQLALEQDPDNVKTLCNLGNAHRDMQQHERAADHYRRALEWKPENVAARNGLGLTLQAQGRLDEAVRQFQQALQIGQDTAKTHSNLGITLLELGKVEQAREEYHAALRVQPENVGAHYNLGNLLAHERRFDEAIRHYRLALTFDPKFSIVHNNLAIALTNAGRTDEAIEQLRAALLENPEAVNWHSNLGVLLHQQGEVAGAVHHLTRALQIDPNYAAAHYNLGNALRASGAVEKAIESYQRALELQFRSADLHNNLGLALRDLDRVDDAIRQFQAALEIDPNHVHAGQNLDQARKIP